MNNLNIKSERLIFSSEGYSLLRINLSSSQHSNYFIIDTGSSQSHFFVNSSEYELQQFSIQQRKKVIFFKINDKKFKHSFLLHAKKTWRNIEDNSIVGIIGVDFLSKYKCVIDYHNDLFTWSNKIKQPRDTKFSYPIHIGCRKIGVPIVGMGHVDSSVCCIIDTGANVNIISKDALIECTSINKSLSNRAMLDILGCNCLAYPYQVSFTLACSSQYKVSEVSYSCLCYASNALDKILLSISEQLLVGAILGNDFLRKHQWIINFSSNIMYSF